MTMIMKVMNCHKRMVMVMYSHVTSSSLFMFEAYLLNIYFISIYHNSQIVFTSLISLYDIPYIQTKKSFSIVGKCHTIREGILFSYISPINHLDLFVNAFKNT